MEPTVTDPIDTARAEGIALGLAMVKAVPRFVPSQSWVAGKPFREAVWADAIPDPPIPPHVAAARVLLDVMNSAVWRSAIAAMEPILRADIQPTAWNSEDEIMSALTAALEAWRAMGDHAIMRHDLTHAPPWFLL